MTFASSCSSRSWSAMSASESFAAVVMKPSGVGWGAITRKRAESSFGSAARIPRTLIGLSRGGPGEDGEEGRIGGGGGATSPEDDGTEARTGGGGGRPGGAGAGPGEEELGGRGGIGGSLACFSSASAI